VGIQEQYVARTVKEWKEEVFRFGAPFSTVRLLAALSSNKVTWHNIHLPPDVKKYIVDVVSKEGSWDTTPPRPEYPLVITLMTGPNCSLCTEAKSVITSVSEQLKNVMEIKEVNITEDEELFEQYKHDIPVAFAEGEEIFRHKIDPEELIHYYLAWEQEQSEKE